MHCLIFPPSWSVFAAATFDPCIRIIYQQLYMTAKENRDKAAIEEASKRYDGCAVALEKHLQDRDYICGQQYVPIFNSGLISK